jgi:predicted TIM-barrel fold metal-dependent hydrolase
MDAIGALPRRIDVHCHPNTLEWFTAIGPYVEALRTYWNRPWEPVPEDQVIGELRAADVQVLMVAFDTETVTGCPPCSNDYVAGVRDRHPDVVLNAWASVDPWKGAEALREAEHAVKDLGLIGFHFHPICGGFTVDDPRHRPLFEKIAELGVPALIDVGTTGMGAGLPGGLGRRLKMARPFPALDDLAAELPELTIIAAHPGWPWTEEVLMVCLHKANVYWETSGWGPEYFPEPLKREIPRRLKQKIMFGSDYPSLTHDRLFRGWSKLGFDDDVLDRVFHGNAERILRLEPVKGAAR